MHIPKPLIIVGTVILLGAWFLLDSGRSAFEKMVILSAVVFAYVAYPLVTGASIDEIMLPFIDLFQN